MKRSIFTIAAVALNLSGAVWADDGLYEDVFDPNSSFIRVVAPGQAFASIDGTTVRDIEPGVSDYVNVMPGQIEVVLPAGSVEVEASASMHYTLIMSEDGQSEFVSDNIMNSPAKSDLSFYNLTSLDEIELYVPLAKAVALGDIASMQSQTVAIKAPLVLDFEIRSGGEVLATVSQLELMRSSGVSIVLVETGEGYDAFSTVNSYQK